jgi:sulfite oxidase
MTFSGPFWNIYQQHQTDMVRGILAEFKIGTLKEGEEKFVEKDSTNPYSNEPERHPGIKVNKQAPFNGEPPPSLLTREFITPNELHFIRNRLPVPDVDVRFYVWV